MPPPEGRRPHPKAVWGFDGMPDERLSGPRAAPRLLNDTVESHGTHL